MVKVSLPKGQVVIDPFSGQSLSREEVVRASGAVPAAQRVGGRFRGADGAVSAGRAAAKIIARMLRNIKEIHRTQQDWARLIAVQDRLIILLPQAWGEYRDQGLAHASHGNAQRAVLDLENYLVHAEEAYDLDAVAERVAELRRAKN